MNVRVISKIAPILALVTAGAALVPATAHARCASSSYDACFKFSVKGEIRSEGTWTNTDCSGGASGTGNWSQVTRYRTLRSAVLKVHRWHPRRLFTLEQAHSGGPPFAPARVDIERSSSSSSDSSCGDPDPPGDCGARSATYRQQIVTIAPTRGIRLDFFDSDGAMSNNLRWERCYAAPPQISTLSELKSFALRRFFGRRRLVVHGGGSHPWHRSDGVGSQSGTDTVSWTLTLVRVP